MAQWSLSSGCVHTQEDKGWPTDDPQRTMWGKDTECFIYFFFQQKKEEFKPYELQAQMETSTLKKFHATQSLAVFELPEEWVTVHNNKWIYIKMFKLL